MAKSIRQYKDYRVFLRDRFEQIHAARPKFTYAHCARLLKTSRGYLQLLFAAKRNMDISKIGPVTKLFELGPLESEYFVFLYLENTVEDAFVRRYVRTVLGSLRHSPFADLELDAKYQKQRDSEHTESWAEYVVKSFQDLVHFEPTADWVLANASDKTLERKRVAAAIAKLDTTTPRQKRVRASPKNENTHAGYEIFKVAALKSMQALQDRSRFSPWNYLFYTIPIDRPGFRELIEATREFEKKLLAISNRVKNPDKALSVFVSMFGLNETRSVLESTES